jgi:hypothetical protein
MASSLIGSLRVSLGLDTAQFEAGAKKAQSTARQAAGQMETSFKSARRAAEGLLAAFTVGVLTEQIKKSLDYAGSIAEVSRTLGLTTKDLQTFRYAATQTGVSQDQLEVGLRRLTVSMGKAELGSKAQSKAFGAIGISLDQLKGKNTGEVFRLMADGLSKVTDRSQRAAVEMILMGRSGSQLDNLLAPGSKRLNELSDAAQKLGIVLSDKQIQGAEETAHKLDALKTVLAAQIAGVVADNARSIYDLANALGTLTGQIVRFLGSNPQVALGIIGALAGRALAGGPIGAAAGALVGSIYASQTGKPFDPSANADKALLGHNLRIELDRLHALTKAGADDKAIVAQAEKVKSLSSSLKAALGLSGPVAPPGPDLPKFLGGGPKKAKRQPADRSDELEAQFARDQLQADQSILQAKQQLEGTNEQHLAISLQLIEIERKLADSAIDQQVARAKRDLAEHKITQAAYDEVVTQSAILKQKNDQRAALERQALSEQQIARQDQALFEATNQQYKFTLDALHAADGLATTQADHRRIQLQILDAEIEQQRLELEHSKQLAIRNGATQQEIDNIQAQINQLPTQRAQGASAIEHNTQSPLESYFSNLPHTAAKVNEALQSIEVEGIQGLSGALAKAGQGWGAMRDAAISALQDIASKLIELGIQRAIFSLFGGLVGGARGGGVVDLTHGEIGAFPGLADGGSFRVGGRSGVDRNVLSINGRPRVRVSADETVAVIPRHGFYGLPGMASGGLLSVLSPLAFLATKAGFGSAALPHFGTGGKMNGDTFHIHVNAPNTGNPSRDRRTSLQQAADIRHAVAGAAAKGLA